METKQVMALLASVLVTASMVWVVGSRPVVATRDYVEPDPYGNRPDLNSDLEPYKKAQVMEQVKGDGTELNNYGDPIPKAPVHKAAPCHNTKEWCDEHNNAKSKPCHWVVDPDGNPNNVTMKLVGTDLAPCKSHAILKN